MNLNNCKLKLIEFPETPAGEKTDLFPRLNALMIASNPLSVVSKLLFLLPLLFLIKKKNEQIILFEVIFKIAFLFYNNSTSFSVRMFVELLFPLYHIAYIL